MKSAPNPAKIFNNFNMCPQSAHPQNRRPRVNLALALKFTYLPIMAFAPTLAGLLLRLIRP